MVRDYGPPPHQWQRRGHPHFEASADEGKHSKMHNENRDDNVVPLFNRDVFLDPIQAHKTVDRFPLEIGNPPGGRRFIGVLDADGHLCRPQGLRSPKATRPLTMRDRFIVWDYNTDSAEIVRLGAMTSEDLIRASAHYNASHPGHLGKPGLLAQALGLLWKVASCFEGLQPNDPRSTMESINDADGHSVLDHRWSPTW